MAPVKSCGLRVLCVDPTGAGSFSEASARGERVSTVLTAGIGARKRDEPGDAIFTRLHCGYAFSVQSAR